MDSTNYILDVGKASDSFRESAIPKEFFFGYLYLSTPIQIFDLNRYEMNLPIIDFFVSNITPDFISKRIGYGTSNIGLESVNGFNVGGFFLSPYKHLGDLGVFLILCYYFLFFCLVYSAVMKKKKRALVSLAIFNAISLLLPFNNLLNASGYILQLYYALFFTGLLSVKFNGKSMLPSRSRG
ncbi:hypothetical protein [Aeromonas veronii]|uniref:hypothetical protein n=1 Tax=Aeromonas veronii TaxID=654 RepID=UPI003D202B3A